MHNNLAASRIFYSWRICFLLIPFVFVLFPLFTAQGVSALKLSEDLLNIYSRNNILFYDPNGGNCADTLLGLTQGTLAGSGNYNAVLSAKNADKSIFNGKGDVPTANWSDTDKSSMKQLLETYGDLAYQLGAAVGAPYVAILVQMRYEDPKSACGANNFWGNGCPPGTGVGGASKQGRNLGEGFVMYAETLTNGYHDQALGISDPKTYLEKIGPTWVQGNINGPGYGSIGAMKKSVDALQSFIDSEEGQAIVSQFGNYHGSGGDYCRCSASGFASSAKWEDGWIADGSIPGIHKEDVNGKSDLSESVKAVGSYTTSGGKPNKILLHNTEGTQNGYAAYPSGNKYPAHFTIDLKKKEGYQHFSIWQPSLAIASYDRAGPIQIEIVGFSSSRSPGYKAEYDLQKFTDEDWDYLAQVLAAISNETGIPLTSTVNWGSGNNRMSSGSDFSSYEGVLGHMHAPGNDHGDPGNIWDKVAAAIERAGGYDGACTSGGSGDINATAISLAWPESERKNHSWNDPSPEYKKALEETGIASTAGDNFAKVGASCDAFVATVMRYSGADPDFVCCGVSKNGATASYVKNSGKYEEVPNKLGSLQPGDILLSSDHIELYVEVNGQPKIASASHGQRTGDIRKYSDSYNGNFKAYRLKR